MAAAPESTLQALCEESTCSICLDYFRDPVSIAECGHNFCRDCLSRYSGESDVQASCPQCRGTFRKSNLRPNRHLANFVEIARKSEEQALKGAEGKGRLCEKHQEPLKLFCRDHEAPICLVCDRAKEHEGHKVVPLEEASQEYQDQQQHRLESLRDERGRILACKAEAESEKQALLEQMKAEREETVAQFRRLHQFLEEQEKRLLAEVDELQEEIARRAEDHLARLSKELSSLEGLMREVEEKSWQPAAELLQDVRSTLRRSEKEPCEIPAAFPLELKWRIWDFSDKTPVLEGWMKQFQGLMRESKGIKIRLGRSSPLFPLLFSRMVKAEMREFLWRPHHFLNLLLPSFRMGKISWCGEGFLEIFISALGFHHLESLGLPLVWQSCLSQNHTIACPEGTQNAIKSSPLREQDTGYTIPLRERSTPFFPNSPDVEEPGSSPGNWSHWEVALTIRGSCRVPGLPLVCCCLGSFSASCNLGGARRGRFL